MCRTSEDHVSRNDIMSTGEPKVGSRSEVTFTPNKKNLKRRRNTPKAPRKSTALEQSEPTILDFITSTGESTDELTKEGLERYSDRELLNLSASWARMIQEKQGDNIDMDDETHHLSRRLDKLTASLSTDCARVEVEAMSLLASLEAKGGDSSCSEMDENNEIDDDEEFTGELSRLDDGTSDLSKELDLAAEEMNSSHTLILAEDDDLDTAEDKKFVDEEHDDDLIRYTSVHSFPSRLQRTRSTPSSVERRRRMNLLDRLPGVI